MTESYTIYQIPVDKFKKRLWTLFGPYLILYGLMLTPMFLNLGGFKPIIISYFILILLLSLDMLRSCYKWTIRKVSRISIVGDNFEIEIIEKDDIKIHSIPIQNFNITTKRSWGRPRVLTLTFFNLRNKIVNLYAATSKDTSDLDYLKYTIDKQIG